MFLLVIILGKAPDKAGVRLALVGVLVSRSSIRTVRDILK